MAKNIKQLNRNIMRRVYYAYTLRIITDPLRVYGFIMGISLIFMMQFVSVPSIINNLMQIEVGAVPHYAYNAFTTTESWTLVFLGVIIFAALSLRFELRMPKYRTLKKV